MWLFNGAIFKFIDTVFLSITRMNGLSKDIDLDQRSKVAVCWKFQLISKWKIEEKSKSIFFLAYR